MMFGTCTIERTLHQMLSEQVWISCYEKLKLNKQKSDILCLEFLYLGLVFLTHKHLVKDKLIDNFFNFNMTIIIAVLL